jgi:hypothetical protein
MLRNEMNRLIHEEQDIIHLLKNGTSNEQRRLTLIDNLEQISQRKNLLMQQMLTNISHIHNSQRTKQKRNSNNSNQNSKRPKLLPVNNSSNEYQTAPSTPVNDSNKTENLNVNLNRNLANLKTLLEQQDKDIYKIADILVKKKIPTFPIYKNDGLPGRSARKVLNSKLRLNIQYPIIWEILRDVPIEILSLEYNSTLDDLYLETATKKEKPLPINGFPDNISHIYYNILFSNKHTQLPKLPKNLKSIQFGEKVYSIEKNNTLVLIKLVGESPPNNKCIVLNPAGNIILRASESGKQWIKINNYN